MKRYIILIILIFGVYNSNAQLRAIKSAWDDVIGFFVKKRPAKYPNYNAYREVVVNDPFYISLQKSNSSLTEMYGEEALSAVFRNRNNVNKDPIVEYFERISNESSKRLQQSALRIKTKKESILQELHKSYLKRVQKEQRILKIYGLSDNIPLSESQINSITTNHIKYIEFKRNFESSCENVSDYKNVLHSLETELIDDMNLLNLNPKKQLEFNSLYKDFRLNHPEVLLENTKSYLESEKKNLLQRFQTINSKFDANNNVQEVIPIFQNDELIEITSVFDSQTSKRLTTLEQSIIDDINLIGRNGKGLTDLKSIKNDLEQTGFEISDFSLFISESKSQIKREFNLIGENLDKLDNLKIITKKFQAKHSLNTTGSFDYMTKQKVAEIEKEIGSLLESSIDDIEKYSLSEQIGIYKKNKGLKNQEIVADHEFIESLKSNKYYYINISNQYEAFLKSKFKVEGLGGNSIKVINSIKFREGSNVYVSLEGNAKDAILKLKKNMNRVYHPDEITILPFVKNTDTKRILNNTFKKNWIKVNFYSNKNISKKIAKNKRKTIFTVGHIENGYYVEEGNELISIAELNKLARDNNISMFHFGCSTAEFNSGTSSAINTKNTVEALIPSINNNNNIQDMFLELSNQPIGPNRKVVKLLIDSESFQDHGYMKIKTLSENTELAGDFTLVVGGVLGWYFWEEE